MRKAILLILFAGVPAQAARYALRGTVVTPSNVIANGVVVVDGDTIVDVVVGLPAGLAVIDTGGVIFPGLIDLHNHVTWNAFPRWSAGRTLTARYDWLSDQDYLDSLANPHGDLAKVNCDLERYGEVKALVHGATAIAGSLDNPCDRGLIRNIDYDRGFAGRPPAQYRVFPFEVGGDEESSIRAALATGNVVIIHLAEGTTESSRRELSMLRAHGFLKRGLIAIHGVALKNTGFSQDFKLLHDAGVGLVWSPRSNIELYGQTLDLKTALAEKITIAVSPDWSPSGSDGMIPEMTYAWNWVKANGNPITAKNLVEMATINPATLIGDKTGRIEKGSAADLLVVAPNAHTDPYETLVETRPAGVQLVVVGGKPLYGDEALVKKVNPNAKTETLSICGATKAVDMSDSDGGEGVSWAETQRRLTEAMGKLKKPIKLADLDECR